MDHDHGGTSGRSIHGFIDVQQQVSHSVCRAIPGEVALSLAVGLRRDFDLVGGFGLHGGGHSAPSCHRGVVAASTGCAAGWCHEDE